MRFFPVSAEVGQIHFLRGVSSDWVLRGLFAGTTLLVAGSLVWRALGHPEPALLTVGLACTLLAADALRTFELSLLNASRRQRDYSLRNALDAWARPLTASLAIVTLGPSAMSVLLGYAAGSLGVSGLLRRRVVKHGDAAARPDADHWQPSFRRDFLQYAFPLVPYALLQWTMSLSDRYFLAGFEGTVSVGLYAAAYGLGSQPFIAANTFIHSVLRPVLYDAVAQGDRAKERKTLALWLTAAVFVSGAGVSLFVLFSTPIAQGLLGREFWGSAQLLPWIAGAYALQSVQQTFEIVLYAHGRTRQVVWVQGIAAAVSVLLYLLLIPRFGAWGAALGTLGTFFLTAAVSAMLARACLRDTTLNSA